jgi:hypothetical protein
MAERATPANPRRNGDEHENREALIAEIARQKEENLRLRNLLIAREAELGTVKGRLAELTAYSSRPIIAVQAVRTLISRLVSGTSASFRRRG